MTKLNLDNLELQIYQLIESSNSVVTNNLLLQQKVDELTNKYNSLLSKKKEMVESLKTIINQLQAELPCQMQKQQKQ